MDIAGAGTGKTKSLTFRTAYLLEKGFDLANILILMFTNKAANEMKERIGRLLGRKRVRDVTACTFYSFCCKLLRIYAEHIKISRR